MSFLAFNFYYSYLSQNIKDLLQWRKRKKLSIFSVWSIRVHFCRRENNQWLFKERCWQTKPNLLIKEPLKKPIANLSSFDIFCMSFCSWFYFVKKALLLNTIHLMPFIYGFSDHLPKMMFDMMSFDPFDHFNCPLLLWNLKANAGKNDDSSSGAHLSWQHRGIFIWRKGQL